MGYDAVYDKMKDECGVFGIWALGQSEEAANFTYLGLHALQHRGQESAGIVATDGETLHVHRDMGLVADVFTAPVLERLKGGAAIGHVRYSTTGASHVKNAQPVAVQYAGGAVAVAHNGNLVNAEALRADLEAQGSIFTASTDTEVIVHLLARSCPVGTPGTPEYLASSIRQALGKVAGAYSLLFLTPRALVGVRDPMGFRPLVIGRLKGSYCLASETTALDLIEAEYLREVEPGEMVILDQGGLRSERLFPDQRPPQRFGRCVFEHIYFARPDSVLFGKSVYAVRQELGRRLAQECPAEADLVIPVPDSGVPAAIGYAEQSRVPFAMGLVRSHYVGRTFIEPQQSIRHFGVKLKLNALRDVLRGKRVVVVDDSVVRGTTSRKIVEDDPRRGRERGAPAHQLAAHRLALLLRHRHAHAPGAHRLQPHRGGDHQARHGRLARLSLAGGRLPGHRRVALGVLRRLLLGRVPDPVLPAACGRAAAGGGRLTRPGATIPRGGVTLDG